MVEWAISEIVAELVGVTKSFGDVQALRGVDLSVRPGEVVALLGPNGAGKTTVLSILLGQRKPDDGTAKLYGGNPRLAINRSRVGVTPQDTAFPETLKIGEIIALVAAHFHKPPQIGQTIERFGLSDLTERQVNALSGGERRRLSVALAFAGGADTVFLDEPTTGMDVSARAKLWDEVRAFTGNGGTLFLTTHYLEEAEALASRVVLIDHGKIVRQGSVDEIKSVVEVRKLTFRATACPELPSVVGTENDGDLHTVLCRDADAAVRALVTSGVEFHDLEVRAVSLEDAVVATLEGRV